MKIQLNLYWFTVCLNILLLSTRAIGTESMLKSTTGAAFPSQIELHSGLQKKILGATGVASRKISFFNIYSIVNYLEMIEKKTVHIVSSIENTTLAKQLTINFERTIDVEMIRKQLRNSYTSNASSKDLEATKNSLNLFISAISSGVTHGDRFTVRCFSGGRIKAFFKNKKIIELRDPLFAKVFWSIWFGDKAVVDRTELLNRIAGNEHGVR